jgi:hypothetical protein
VMIPLAWVEGFNGREGTCFGREASPGGFIPKDKKSHPSAKFESFVGDRVIMTHRLNF